MDAAKIYTYSVLFSSSQEFKDKVPYITAILERSNGERFASIVDGYKDGTTIAIGQKVVCTGRDSSGKETYAIA